MKGAPVVVVVVEVEVVVEVVVVEVVVVGGEVVVAVVGGEVVVSRVHVSCDAAGGGAVCVCMYRCVWVCVCVHPSIPRTTTTIKQKQ